MSCCLNFSNSEYVVGCSDGSIHIIHKSTHKHTKSLLKEHLEWIGSLILLEDKLISGSYDGMIKVWQLSDTTIKSLSTLSHNEKVTQHSQPQWMGAHFGICEGKNHC